MRRMSVLRETMLIEGEGSQTNTLRWEDYSTTAMAPGGRRSDRPRQNARSCLRLCRSPRPGG